MKNSLLKNIIRFIVLILAQVLLFNNMNINNYLNPYVYILIIMLLPIHINRSLLLIIAFVTGITIDYFGNTLGLHAFASVFIAFMRPGLLKLLFRNTEFKDEEEPVPFVIGWGGFIRYSIIMVFTFQFVLFNIEALSFNNFLFTLLKVLFSSILTLFLILIVMLVFSKRKLSI
jgi:rod shape-determining protein MreD